MWWWCDGVGLKGLEGTMNNLPSGHELKRTCVLKQANDLNIP